MNLRAALFRALSDLKKNGMLGKETMLRKTMLDDCRGDKLEEILAKFALMVLRKFGKAVAPPDAAHTIFEREQSSDRATIIPLIIAHQKGLKGLLASRNAEAQKFAHVQQILDSEDQRLQATGEKRALRRQSSFEAIRNRAENARQRLEQAWNGDETWVDVLVNGGGENVMPTVSQNTFEEIWRPAQKGNAVATDTTSSNDLLDDLKNRIAGQEKRIEDWKTFKSKFNLQSKQAGRDVEKPGTAQTQDTFQDHKALQFEPQDTKKNPTTQTASFNNPSVDLLERMHASLAALKSDKRRTSIVLEDTAGKDMRLDESPIQNPKVSSWHSDPPKPYSRLPIDKLGGSLENRDLVADSKKCSETTHSTVRPRASDNTQSVLSKSPPKVKAKRNKRETSPHRQQSRNLQTKITGYSPIRALSPLAEDRKPNPETEPDPPSPDLPSPPAPPEGLFPRATTATTTTIPVSNLIERTRQSMSLLPNHNNPSYHPSKQARKSTQYHPRPSQTFPVNPFQTPLPSAAKVAAPTTMSLSPRLESGSSTPRDSLFSEDADYASVFKSRPRVAQSPRESLSPQRSGKGRMDEEGEEGEEEEWGEEDNKDDGEGWVAGSSPLRAMR